MAAGDISRDSIFDSSYNSVDRDSIFGTDDSHVQQHRPVKKEPSTKQFFLRPLSEISTASSTSETDTFVNHTAIKWKKEENCLEAEGEDETMCEHFHFISLRK